MFRRLLWTEWKRAVRAEQPLFLVLVRVNRHPVTTRVPAPVSARVFAALTQAVRDVDFTGWYRDGRLAGAVLAQVGDPPDAEARAGIRQRVVTSLEQQLPAIAARGMSVKVVEVRSERRSFAR
ncbi:MAG: hypothetical protein AB7F99_05310 [Vicinamibacterales bacterium]